MFVGINFKSRTTEAPMTEDSKVETQDNHMATQYTSIYGLLSVRAPISEVIRPVATLRGGVTVTNRAQCHDWPAISAGGFRMSPQRHRGNTTMGIKGLGSIIRRPEVPRSQIYGLASGYTAARDAVVVRPSSQPKHKPRPLYLTFHHQVSVTMIVDAHNTKSEVSCIEWLWLKVGGWLEADRAEAKVSA